MQKCFVCTWLVQKVSGLTTVHEVDKAYGVLTLIVFNIVPLRSYTLRPTFVPLLETFCELLFGMSNSVFVEFLLMFSVVSNRCPFRTFLNLGKRKKSHGLRSGEYGSCCNWAVPCLSKNCCTRCEVCVCVWAHCHGAGSSCHSAIFPVVFGELIHAMAQDFQVVFLVNCLPIRSVLVVYDTLRIKKRQ